MSVLTDRDDVTVRHHRTGDSASVAVYSRCGRYRYVLTRDWGAGPRWVFLMLNPSTATEVRNDPTVTRCEARARAAGCGGYTVVNLFAFRATRPAELFAADDPVGPLNDAAIAQAAASADRILCAWGALGTALGRAAWVEAALRTAGYPLWHFGTCADGSPRHPLYLPNAAMPVLRLPG